MRPTISSQMKTKESINLNNNSNPQWRPAGKISAVMMSPPYVITTINSAKIIITKCVGER